MRYEKILQTRLTHDVIMIMSAGNSTFNQSFNGFYGYGGGFAPAFQGFGGFAVGQNGVRGLLQNELNGFNPGDGDGCFGLGFGGLVSRSYGGYG